ncbi:Zn-ribbon domain-containing OB-fold protein [Microcella pacifica]|uniref:Zn-ribbon domain-containing OB-fold protein n=1 Tax=Microcella pacifica TaxID=2591847 RepID=UPI0033145ECD
MTISDGLTTAEARLLGQRCVEGHEWYLPRQRCPECASAVSVFELSGSGTVFAQTSLHRHVSASAGFATGSERASAKKEAIGIALVDLDEGVRMMARCIPGTPIGSRVVVSIVRDRASHKLVPLCEVVAG